MQPVTRRALADQLPLKPVEPSKPAGGPTPAPAWVALLAAWCGLIVLACAVVFVFLPGSRNPTAELEHAVPYSAKDRFLPVPIYGIAFAMFLGIVVLWQMRREPRPLPPAMVAQRLQACVGIVLALVAAGIVYGYVALFGPKH